MKEVFQTLTASAKGRAEADADELYADAVAIVRTYGRGNTSVLQRGLRIGYGRAFHLLERMQREAVLDHDFKLTRKGS